MSANFAIIDDLVQSTRGGSDPSAQTLVCDVTESRHPATSQLAAQGGSVHSPSVHVFAGVCSLEMQEWPHLARGHRGGGGCYLLFMRMRTMMEKGALTLRER